MTVDDLFPEEEGGDDHPIMALFNAPHPFLELLSSMFKDDDELAKALRGIDVPPTDSASVSNP